jgi:hypothetical protein
MTAGGIIALIFGGVLGLGWAFTASAAQGCTLTGQLDGMLCYPTLAQAHSIFGPLALVVIILGVVLIIAGQNTRNSAGTPPRRTRSPDCVRCGYQLEAHIGGRCPGQRPPPDQDPEPG